MTSFACDQNTSHYQILAFKPGFLQVNQTVYTQSIILTPSALYDWAVTTIDELSIVSLQKIIDIKPALLLIGTGETLIFPDMATYGPLINEGIGVEIMNTAAACRTFSALSAENRNVAAALIV